MNAPNPEQAVIAPVRHSVVVNAPVGRAFRVFTDGFGTWWPKSHTISEAPVERAIIEPRAGGTFVPDGERTEVTLVHDEFERHGSTGADLADGVRDGWGMPLQPSPRSSARGQPRILPPRLADALHALGFCA